MPPEQRVLVLKSIGFPLEVLNCIDKSASIEGLSRSAFVVSAVKEYIIKHEYEQKTGIKI